MNKQEDLDLAILSALLKATSGASEDQRLKQVKLALTWNRVDIAQEEIFREDVLWKPGKFSFMAELNVLASDPLLYTDNK